MPQSKILVVEDESIVAMDIKQRLTAMDYKVTGTVSNGAAAIVQIIKDKPDLILMDIQIEGDTDGIETATIIQERFDVPVVYLTANSDVVTVDRANKTMPLGFLLKPFEDRDLRTTVEVALLRHKLECELRRSEQAMRESETRYRSLFEYSNDAVVIHDLEGQILEVNERTCELLGYQEDELLRLKITSFRPKDWQPQGCSPLRIVRKKGHIRFESYFERADGRRLDVEISSRVVDREKGAVQSIIRDITERKRAEEELLVTNQRYRSLTDDVLNSTNTGLFILDTDFKVVWLNQYVELYFGLRREDVIGKDKRQLIRENIQHIFEDPDTFQSKVIATYDDNTYVEKFECYVLPNGEREGRWLEHNSHPIRTGLYAGGRVEIYFDITSRKQAERLHELARFPNENPGPVMRASGEGVLVYANKASWRLLKFWNSRVNESIPDKWKKIVKFALDNQEITKKTVRCEGLIYSLVFSPFTSSGYVNIYGNDITELKRAEENERKLQTVLERAERLEMAGTIAAQVAHDFNNLLGPLMAYPEIIREGLPGDHPALEYLDLIETATHKIADINRDLLTMGRRGHYNQEVLNLNAVVQNAVAELEPYRKTLSCDIILSDDLMDILGGGAQLHRMISNLLHNARDAMQDIGKITVKTENYYVDDVSVIYGRVPKGEYVKLTVSDTGCGIPDDIVQKIFDPFFTSKTTDKKRGSGLGMSVVDSVVKDHNGFIDLSTKVGEGTSFYIYFPITRESKDSRDSDKTRGGSETILVVDDDDIQREVSTVLLKKLGYTVNTVESGEKAIDFLRENARDLVVLDMVMPGGIDGAETYRQIVEFSPHQKAILLSGFSESDRVLEAQKLGTGAFVKKPVTLQVIAAAVRKELDREANTLD